jgi:hypothetical protein
MLNPPAGGDTEGTKVTEEGELYPWPLKYKPVDISWNVAVIVDHPP